MSNERAERRKYLRLASPVKAKIITEDIVINPEVRNFSPIGIRLETDQSIGENTAFEIALELPEAENPVHIHCKVIWQKEEEKGAGIFYDVGATFLEIEEDNKNTFLKVLCDFLYEQKVS